MDELVLLHCRYSSNEISASRSLHASMIRRRIDLLASALADLGCLHHEVILLRGIEEVSAPEASQRLGISVDALKSRPHRARVKLREHQPS